MTGLPERILCIDLRQGRFGYTVFEGPDRLLDWGTRSLNGNAIASGRPMATIDALLHEWQPERVILGGPRDSIELPRNPVGTAIERVCSTIRLPVRHVRRKEVLAMFSGVNKYVAARAICVHFPEIEHRLPDHPRRIYENEPYSMTVFDAAALGLAYFRRKARRASPTAQANH